MLFLKKIQNKKIQEWEMTHQWKVQFKCLGKENSTSVRGNVQGKEMEYITSRSFRTSRFIFLISQEVQWKMTAGISPIAHLCQIP
jgi:hypothetical protein